MGVVVYTERLEISVFTMKIQEKRLIIVQGLSGVPNHLRSLLWTQFDTRMHAD